MSKKKFTEGLESIFDSAKEEAATGTTALLRGAGLTADDKEGSTKKSSSRKSFTTDLDSLLQEALQEVIDEQMPQASSDTKAQVFHQQTHRRKPLSGLDILIRKTVESSTLEFEDSPTPTKRITVAFEKKKLDKLKRIARLEKAYLKDILGELVAEYIKKYETKKGKLGNED